MSLRYLAFPGGRLQEALETEKLFEDAARLLDFLQKDHPERYVFRGQTRVYPGPMLPSGYRRGFTRFTSSGGPLKWAGITQSRSKVRGELERRMDNISAAPSTQTWEHVQDDQSTWDLPEAAYQAGFQTFFNQPHTDIITANVELHKGAMVIGLSELIDDRVGDLLCQQYGFTSIY